MRFQKGQSGNPAGQRRGSKQRLTIEVRALAQRLFDRSYWRLKYDRIHSGEEHPKIEGLLLSYAFGLPQRDEQVNSAVIQLGPLEALQALARQQAHSLDAPAFSLPDVTGEAVDHSQVVPAVDAAAFDQAHGLAPSDRPLPQQQVASQPVVPTPATALRVVAGTAAVGHTQQHDKRNAGAGEQQETETTNGTVKPAKSLTD